MDVGICTVEVCREDSCHLWIKLGTLYEGTFIETLDLR